MVSGWRVWAAYRTFEQRLLSAIQSAGQSNRLSLLLVLYTVRLVCHV